MNPEENMTRKIKFIREAGYLPSCVIGDTVLDCFMGSGTTGVACVRNNRKFIGIELQEKYYEIARNRIAEEQQILGK